MQAVPIPDHQCGGIETGEKRNRSALGCRNQDRAHKASIGKKVGPDAKGIERLQVAIKLNNTAAVRPPRSLPKNVQFPRPTATPRFARSLAEGVKQSV